MDYHVCELVLKQELCLWVALLGDLSHAIHLVFNCFLFPQLRSDAAPSKVPRVDCLCHLIQRRSVLFHRVRRSDCFGLKEVRVFDCLSEVVDFDTRFVSFLVIAHSDY